MRRGIAVSTSVLDYSGLISRWKAIGESYKRSPKTCPITEAGTGLVLVVEKTCLYGGWFALSVVLGGYMRPDWFSVIHRQTGIAMCEQFPSLELAKRFVDHVSRWHVDQVLLNCKTTTKRLSRYVRLLRDDWYRRSRDWGRV